MLRYLTSGESHGPKLTAVIDGFPAGFTVDVAQINFQLARRQKGYGRGGRMKIEQDEAEIVSGVRSGVTMGGPITFVIRNKDWANWTELMDPLRPVSEDLGLREKRLKEQTTRPRPGHADLAGGIKYNHHDLRNVLERASARETAARTAIGALARQFLEHFDIEFASHVVRIGTVALESAYDLTDLEEVRKRSEASEVRCLDKATEHDMIEEIKAAKVGRDSVGGVVEVIVRGLPAGLGGFSQWSDRLDGRLAQSLMSIHSVKGVEIGLGFESATMRGSQVHDQIFFDPGGDRQSRGFFRETNRAGGLEGGITNGEDIILRVANKPISTLNQPLKTVDVVTKKPAEAMVERTDNCITPALCVVCEAVTALVLADAFLYKFSSDNLTDIDRNWQSWLAAGY